MLTTCRHKMNEALHLQERVHIKHCKQPPRITAPVHATPIPTSVRAPLKAPHWALRGYPTGPPRRHPLRGGLRPSGRPPRRAAASARRPHALRRALIPACAACAPARPQATPCPRPAAPRDLTLLEAARRDGSCLVGLGEAAEAEEEVDLVLTIAPIKVLRPRAGEA